MVTNIHLILNIFVNTLLMIISGYIFENVFGIVMICSKKHP